MSAGREGNQERVQNEQGVDIKKNLSSTSPVERDPGKPIAKSRDPNAVCLSVDLILVRCKVPLGIGQQLTIEDGAPSIPARVTVLLCQTS